MFTAVTTNSARPISAELPWPVLVFGMPASAIWTGLLIGGSVSFVECAITAPTRAGAAWATRPALLAAKLSSPREWAR
jgi:hypothetical protein